MANAPIGAGTTVLCDCAVGVPVKLVILGGAMRSANVSDCTIANVPTFGTCKAPNVNPLLPVVGVGACIPQYVGWWAPGSDTDKADGKPQLTAASVLLCRMGGRVSIFGAVGAPKPVPRDVAEIIAQRGALNAGKR